MNISIENSSQLDKRELIEMAEIMSAAFMGHPNFKEMINSEHKRKKALYYLFLMMYKVINKYGYIYVVKDKNPIGYITFMDVFDKHQISLYRVIRTKGLFHFFCFVFQLKLSEIRKFLKYMKSYSKHHINEVTLKSIHLYSVGVEHNHKGFGYMSKAIRETIQHFKDKGYKTMILETSDISNLPIYEKIGFELVNQLPIKNSRQIIYFLEFEL